MSLGIALLKWLVCIVLALDGLRMVVNVGKPRKPIDGSEAAIAIIQVALTIWMVWA